MVPLNECPSLTLVTSPPPRSFALGDVDSALSDCFRNLIESPILSSVQFKKQKTGINRSFCFLMVPLNECPSLTLVTSPPPRSFALGDVDSALSDCWRNLVESPILSSVQFKKQKGRY